MSKINILIPAAGNGRRFADVGYKDPKPFIEVKGKTMIENVLDNLRYQNAKYIIMAREDHVDKRYDLVKKIQDNYNVEFVVVKKLTEGAACTVLKARELINNETPLFIANSDQIVDIDIANFIDDAFARRLDGSILTFIDKEKNPKWSFVKAKEDGLITEVREKSPISNRATVGIYLFSKGKNFVDSAIDMIVENDRINNEFYVCPVYNYCIKKGQKIGYFDIDSNSMNGIGTPEDLEIYLKK
jgi:NDP-sugar pyrophosphorylase family protein